MRSTLILAVLVLSGCASTRRQAYVDQHSGTLYAQEILSGKVVVGMSGDEVRASWGPPKRLSRTVGRITRETWGYGHYTLHGIFRTTTSFFLKQCTSRNCPIHKFHGHITGWYER